MTQNKARRTNKIDFLHLSWAQGVPGSNPGARPFSVRSYDPRSFTSFRISPAGSHSSPAVTRSRPQNASSSNPGVPTIFCSLLTIGRNVHLRQVICALEKSFWGCRAVRRHRFHVVHKIGEGQGATIQRPYRVGPVVETGASGLTAARAPRARSHTHRRDLPAAFATGVATREPSGDSRMLPYSPGSEIWASCLPGQTGGVLLPSNL